MIWLKRRKQRQRVKVVMEKMVDALKQWRKSTDSIQRKSKVGKLEGKIIKYRVKGNAWLKSNGSLQSPRTHFFNTQVLVPILWDRSGVKGLWPQLYKLPKVSEKQKTKCRSQKWEKPWSRGAPHSLLLATTVCHPMASGESMLQRVAASIHEKRQQLRRAVQTDSTVDTCIWVRHLGILCSARQAFLVGFISF